MRAPQLLVFDDHLRNIGDKPKTIKSLP